MQRDMLGCTLHGMLAVRATLLLARQVVQMQSFARLLCALAFRCVPSGVLHVTLWTLVWHMSPALCTLRVVVGSGTS